MKSARGARVLLLVLVAVVGAVGLSACGGGDDDRATTDVETAGSTAATAPPTTPPTSAAVPATVAPDADGVTLNVFFTRNDLVGVGHRRIASTPSVARAATQLLLGGPTAEERSAGLSSAIPTGTRLLGVDLADGVLTADLSSDFVTGADAPTMRRRLAQLVFTLTQFPTVQSVRVRIDGAPTTTLGTSGVTMPGPLTRADFTTETPRILLETPAPGDLVKGSARLAGTSSTFENNVRIRIVGADGRTLADTFTTAKAGPVGAWSPFDATVAFDRGTNTTGKVVAFEVSAKDGSEINVVEVPVRFA